MARLLFPLVDVLIGTPNSGPRLGAAALLTHGVEIELFADRACTTPADCTDLAGAPITSVVVDGVTLPQFYGPPLGEVIVYGRPVGAIGNGFPMTAITSPPTLASERARARVASRMATRDRFPVREVVLGSSTPAGLNATREELRWWNRFVAAQQAAYPSGVPSWEPPVMSLADGAAALSKLPGIHAYNGAVGGTTSASYVNATILGYLATVQPDVVYHMIGANDYVLDVEPATFGANLAGQFAAIDGVVTVDPLHVIVSTYARPDELSPGWAWDEYVDQMQTAAAALGDRGVFLDLNPAYVAAQAGTTDPLDLIDFDLIHQTDQGHAFMADLVRVGMAVPGPVARPQYAALDRFLVDGTPSRAETGQWWAVLVGTWAVTSGRLVPSVGGNIVLADAGAAGAVRAGAVLRAGAAAIPGVCVRMSTDNLIRLGAHINQTSQSVDLYKVIGGTSTLVATQPTTITSGLDYFLEIDVDAAGKVQVYLNGDRRIVATLSGGDNTALSGTGVGFRAATVTGVQFDHLGVITGAGPKRVDQLAPAVVQTGVTGSPTITPSMLPSTRTLVLGGNLTPALSGAFDASVGGSVTLVLKQPAAGGPYTVTWPAAIEWNQDVAPVMPTAANAELIVHLFWTGSAWRGFVAGVFLP